MPGYDDNSAIFFAYAPRDPRWSNLWQTCLLAGVFVWMSRDAQVTGRAPVIGTPLRSAPAWPRSSAPRHQRRRRVPVLMLSDGARQSELGLPEAVRPTLPGPVQKQDDRPGIRLTPNLRHVNHVVIVFAFDGQPPGCCSCGPN